MFFQVLKKYPKVYLGTPQLLSYALESDRSILEFLFNYAYNSNAHISFENFIILR